MKALLPYDRKHRRLALNGEESLTPAGVRQGVSFVNSIIYLIGLIVVVLAILSFFGLR
ncbi:hypothetical protein [Consotaella salsifontis]|uniref:Uncharacterized protein n=1 Tax=Consotaella salsifontis TaxID=1365950 RepID=A0A1T4T8B6_9HYPH|nr:hypothetical protein [Consotaella salsifontis]SKA36725.1 hypothetical protein SAMN05428963_1217 [Consotaella salsifontis]